MITSTNTKTDTNADTDMDTNTQPSKQTSKQERKQAKRTGGSTITTTTMTMLADLPETLLQANIMASVCPADRQRLLEVSKAVRKQAVLAAPKLTWRPWAHYYMGEDWLLEEARTVVARRGFERFRVEAKSVGHALQTMPQPWRQHLQHLSLTGVQDVKPAQVADLLEALPALITLELFSCHWVDNQDRVMDSINKPGPDERVVIARAGHPRLQRLALTTACSMHGSNGLMFCLEQFPCLHTLCVDTWSFPWKRLPQHISTLLLWGFDWWSEQVERAARAAPHVQTLHQNTWGTMRPGSLAESLQPMMHSLRAMHLTACRTYGGKVKALFERLPGLQELHLQHLRFMTCDATTSSSSDSDRRVRVVAEDVQDADLAGGWWQREQVGLAVNQEVVFELSSSRMGGGLDAAAIRLQVRLQLPQQYTLRICGNLELLTAEHASAHIAPFLTCDGATCSAVSLVGYGHGGGLFVLRDEQLAALEALRVCVCWSS